MDKQFYYVGKDYLNTEYKEVYTRQSRFLKIYYNLSGDPYFNFKGKRYRLDRFLRLSSMWASGNIEIFSADGETVLLCGSEIDSYYKPYFIELSEDGEAARVYQYERTDRNE